MCDPLWLLQSPEEVHYKLLHVPVSTLWGAYSVSQKCGALRKASARPTMFYVENLRTTFVVNADLCRRASTEVVFMMYLTFAGVAYVPRAQAPSRNLTLALFFSSLLGPDCFYAICVPQFRHLSEGHPRVDMNELLARVVVPSDIPLRLKGVSLDCLARVLSLSHPSLGFRSDKSNVYRPDVLRRQTAKYFTVCLFEIVKSSDEEIASLLVSFNPFNDVVDGKKLRVPLVRAANVLLGYIFGERLSQLFFVPSVSVCSSHPSYDWPRKVPESTVLMCLENYYKNSQYVAPSACAVCGRSKHGEKVLDFTSGPASNRRSVDELHLDVLNFENSGMDNHVENHFLHGNVKLNKKVLDFSVVRPDDLSKGEHLVPVCSCCLERLCKGFLPKFALANGLYRGMLPDEFRDVTWVEEAVCAIFRSTAMVTRLYGASDNDPRNPFKMRGNTCAHEMNVASTAKKLPRTPEDVAGMISVVFIGTAPLNKWSLRSVFRVRKKKICRFLLFLKRNNPLYFDVPLDMDVLQGYPDDGTLPGLEERLIHVDMSPEDVFEDETSGIEQHPASTATHSAGVDASSGDSFFFERTGVSDPEGSTLRGRELEASALRNLSTFGDNPDLLLSNSSKAVPEYGNTALLPGMFPTLFPFGIGGFDNKRCRRKVSFITQVDYLLDSTDRVFRGHNAFIFIVLNIWQRRQAHLYSYFVVKRPYFDQVAERLLSVDKAVLLKMSKVLQKEGHLEHLSADERIAFELLNYVNGISINVPGSQANKLMMRNEIVSYAGFFGIPSLFLTVNPCAQHSPIFQVIVGDSAVDLSSRFPQLAPSKDRATRLANDPVAGADFFQFSVTCLFRDLLGWDFDRKVAASPGVFGTLSSFYGTTEFNNRGQLHGHFLVWLEGAPNPSEIHALLKDSQEYRAQFFEFFDDVVRHDLPDVHCPELADPKYECRAERPQPPPFSLQGLNTEEVEARIADFGAGNDLDAWRVAFQYDVKKCGEKLQRHTHRNVCYKYREDGKCRFLFPHEVVESSYYDEENQAIVLAVRDSTVNFYNPYILVFCRHNHDVRFILSGKSAKAAMFYITDYITKMDVKTYQVLSLLSKAVCDFNERNFANGGVLTTATLKAKELLHTCLAQFQRQQEIHAQQAVRYARGLDDRFSSHETVTMLSKVLQRFVMNAYRISCSSGPEKDDETNDDEEDILRVATDGEGQLIRTNQVTNYFLRDERLFQLTFYDFVRCFKLQKKTAEERDVDGVRSFSLKPTHQLSRTHVLVRMGSVVYDKEDFGKLPRVYGMKLPKESVGDEYYLFMLSHFKPFGLDCPLIQVGVPLQDQFRAYTFDERSTRIMNNWTALTECDDAREADRLKKRDSLSREGRMAAELAKTTHGIDDSMKQMLSAQEFAAQQFKKEIEAQRVALTLMKAGWFEDFEDGPMGGPVLHANFEMSSTTVGVGGKLNSDAAHGPDFGFRYPLFVPGTQMTTWRGQLKKSEEKIAKNRRLPQTTLHTGMGDSNVRATATLNSVDSTASQTPARETVCVRSLTSSLTKEEIDAKILEVRGDSGLNEQQGFAFDLITGSYLQLRRLRECGRELQHEPLRLFLTGPGGTGKTHVVNSVKRVMELFNAAHRIRFLAPTGSAAALLDGMTIHKGLGIRVSRCFSSNAGSTDVHMSVKDRKALRDEWKDVDVLLVDEISMVSLELLCKLDHGLRFVKERPHVYFGGVILIVSGDNFQLPPVGGSPNYNFISEQAAKKNKEIDKRLGALAWHSINSVVELTEQMRMCGDAQFASAVLRLRKRRCTPEDVELFNTRVVQIDEDGQPVNVDVDLSTDRGRRAVVLVERNVVRTTLNMLKARSICSLMDAPQLVMCEALDRYDDDKKVVRNDRPHCDRDALLQVDVDRKNHNASSTLPGVIPMYVGMPVVLREKNISTDLGITNGSTGIVVHITFKSADVVQSADRVVADIVFVYFPDCPVHLQGLPRSVVPLSAVKTKFRAVLPSTASNEPVALSRQQHIMQPSFAITVHAAQGRTCGDVICSLKTGGFSAYVAASRPRSLSNLFLTEAVTLEDLTRPLPVDLVKEEERLCALAFNTKVRAGVLSGPLKSVPGLPFTNTVLYKNAGRCNVIYEVEEDEAEALKTSTRQAVHKRKATSEVMREPRKFKRGRKDLSPSTVNPGRGAVLPTIVVDAKYRLFLASSCRWRMDYSCAYDAVVMSVLLAYLKMSGDARREFRDVSPLLDGVRRCAELLLTNVSLVDFNDSDDRIEACRDDLRQALSEIDSRHFPPAGVSAVVGVGDILSSVLTRNAFPFLIKPLVVCEACGTMDSDTVVSYSGLESLSMGLAASSSVSEFALEGSGSADTRSFSTVQIEFERYRPYPIDFYNTVKFAHRRQGCSAELAFNFQFVKPPPLLYFDVDGSSTDIRLLPSVVFNLRSNDVTYSLCAIIYYKDLHFFVDLYTPSGVFTYDGQKNNGVSEFLCSVDDIFIRGYDCVAAYREGRETVSTYVYARN